MCQKLKCVFKAIKKTSFETNSYPLSVFLKSQTHHNFYLANLYSLYISFVNVSLHLFCIKMSFSEKCVNASISRKSHPRMAFLVVYCQRFEICCQNCISNGALLKNLCNFSNANMSEKSDFNVLL